MVLFTGPCAWDGYWADYLQGRLLELDPGEVEGEGRGS